MLPRDLMRLVLTGAVATAVACARSPAPAGWLPTADDAQSRAFGGWIALQYESPDSESPEGGELLAVGADSVYVLPPEDTVVAIPKAAIRRAVVAAFDAQWGGLAMWTLLGTLSTASHGVGLLVSFPVWVIGGSLATGAASHAPLYEVRRDWAEQGWADVRRFARFPQGLPPTLNRAALRPRPDAAP